VDESLETMEEAILWKSESSSRQLILAGCLPGRFTDDGSGGLEDYDLVIGPADTRGLQSWLNLSSGILPSVSGSGHNRYLKISEGCSNSCSYCTIPSIRGPRRDRPEEDILREARDLVDQGAAEIGLVGQDTGAWKGNGGGVTDVLEKLAAEHPETWFRLYYTHPAHRSPGFLDLLGEYDNIMPYIDMPIQHYSDRILERMGRGYTGETLEQIFAEFDDFSGPVAVRTTLITGYPGETEDDFRMLEDFLSRHSCIRTLVAFPYWAEEGTDEYGRTATEEEVGEGIVQSRLMRLGDVADIHYQRWGDLLHDRVLRVMADSPGLGHCVFDAPDVDGACCLSRELPPGTVVDCRITGSRGSDLIAEVLS
jgi:ribosomal protein S12 methylthiotransferase